MKKIYFAIGAAVAALAIFAGCTRDMVTSMNSLTLETEDYKDGDAKAYISSNTACWENNDQIKLTKYASAVYTHFDGSISITNPGGSNRADVVADGFTTENGDVIYACYPRTKFSGGVTNPASISVYMPASYDYVETNGKQKIEAPMLGKITIAEFEEGQHNPNVMKLKNVCTLLKIRLQAPDPGQGAFNVDKIVVTSSSVTMNGPATINFSGETPYLTMNNPYNHGDENDYVMLNFGNNAVAINGTKDFYIPVPPLPNGQILKIWIHNVFTGHWFTKNVSTTAAITGNTVATLNGPSTNDPDAIYTLYDYITNYNAGSVISGFAPVDLGVAPDNNSKLEIYFSPIVTTGSQYYSGAREIGNSAAFSISGPTGARPNGQYVFVCGFGGGNNAVYSDGMPRTAGHKYRHTMEVQNNGGGNYRAFVTFKDETAGQTITATTDPVAGGLSTSAHVYVFGYNSQNPNPGMKLYGYRIWISGTLYRNFLPAKRTTDNHIGLYDNVSHSFIDLNTGFILGND